LIWDTIYLTNILQLYDIQLGLL